MARILILEDDFDLADRLKTDLEERGHTVFCVEVSKDANSTHRVTAWT